MAQINPALPAVGDLNWGGPLDTAISAVITDVNSIDDRVTSLETSGVGVSGTAGGDLTGTYPNPTLAAITSGATVGSTSAIPVITYDAKGRIISTSTASLSGYSAARDVATATTTSITLAVGKHTPADATSGSLTLTLPTGASAGSIISVEREDAVTANTITITGTIRAATGSMTLTSQYESIDFIAKSDGSWWPYAGHKTKAWLDATYLKSASNLSDLSSAPAARTNLGLKTGATVNISVGTTAPSSPSTNDLWVDTN